MSPFPDGVGSRGGGELKGIPGTGSVAPLSGAPRRIPPSPAPPPRKQSRGLLRHPFLLRRPFSPEFLPCPSGGLDSHYCLGFCGEGDVCLGVLGDRSYSETAGSSQQTIFKKIKDTQLFNFSKHKTRDAHQFLIFFFNNKQHTTTTNNVVYLEVAVRESLTFSPEPTEPAAFGRGPFYPVDPPSRLEPGSQGPWVLFQGGKRCRLGLMPPVGRLFFSHTNLSPRCFFKERRVFPIFCPFPLFRTTFFTLCKVLLELLIESTSNADNKLVQHQQDNHPFGLVCLGLGLLSK